MDFRRHCWFFLAISPEIHNFSDGSRMDMEKTSTWPMKMRVRTIIQSQINHLKKPVKRRAHGQYFVGQHEGEWLPCLFNDTDQCHGLHARFYWSGISFLQINLVFVGVIPSFRRYCWEESAPTAIILLILPQEKHWIDQLGMWPTNTSRLSSLEIGVLPAEEKLPVLYKSSCPFCFWWLIQFHVLIS